MMIFRPVAKLALVLMLCAAPGLASAQIGTTPAVIADPVAQQRNALQDAMAALQAVAANGGYIQVPDHETLHPGDRSLAVSLLDQRLRQSGDLAGPERADPTLMDPVLVAAIKGFQARHGLEQDGVVGPRTLARINETPEELVERIAVNLARLDRIRPNWFGRRIVVNLPAFELTAYRDGEPVLTMPVIVGAPNHQTPEMVSPVTGLVVNPSWTIPPSISQNEIAPRMMNDPGYLIRSGLTVISGGPPDFGGAFIDWYGVRAGYHTVGLRQAPGPHNPLGRLKFNLDNDQMIYLHDTNQRYLFSRARRALSHGCVRVADPMALAEFVAEGVSAPWQGWTRDPAWRTRWVTLPERIEVDLVYQTIWVDDTGALQVREDIYGRDHQAVIAAAADSAAG